MSELPSGWVETTIGEVLQFNYGKGLPERDRSGSGFPVYGSNGVVGYHEKALVPAESLVVGRKGSVGEIHHSRGPCWPIDTTYFVDEFSGMPARFWYYALKGLDLNRLNRAIAIPGLNREDAYQVDIVLPPQTEQKRIADKLDSVLARVDACREHLDRVPTILKRFRQAVLAAATSGKLTEEWRASNETERWLTVKLSEVAKSRLGKMLDKTKNRGTATPYLRNINVRWFGFDLSDIQSIRVTEDEARDLAVNRGDVLICEGGEPGRCAVWQGEDGMYVYQKALHRVRVGPELTPEWLCYSLKDAADVGRLADLFTGTTIKHLTGVALGHFEFVLPPLREQREIILRVEALFAYADRLEARYTAARAQVERLTPALLDKAFRGELVRQDSNDEPASVLLERIRAARAASEGSSGPNRSKGGSRSKTSQKAEVLMLTRKDIQDLHLTTILKERGPLTAEALWSASQLDIDDFYDQLKDEEARGLLREKRGDSSNAPRMLEAA